MIKLYNDDCLEAMKKIPDGSIDMILCDPPYGCTSRNKWDVIIPFEALWKQYERIIKDNGAIVLFGKQPFTSMMILSNSKMYKYNLVWRKNLKSGNLNARKNANGCIRRHYGFLQKTTDI